MTFKPGQSGNPKGRTPGRRNAKTRAVLEKLNGVADALALLGEMVASTEALLALRVTAATALAPYQYPKARVSSARRSISPPSRLSRRRPPASPTSARSPRGASDRSRRGRRSRQHPKGFHRGQDWHRTLEQRIAAIEFTLAKANLNLGIAVDLHQLRARDLLAVTALQRVDQPLTQRVGTAAELF